MIFQSEREPGNPFYQMYVYDFKNQTSTRISTGTGQTTCGWIHPTKNLAMWSSTHLDPRTSQKTKDELEKRKNPIKQKYSWSFDENYSIFTSDLSGKNLKRLTKEKGYHAEGSYSPDGKWIVFASNRQAYTKKLTDQEKKFLDRDPSYFMDIYIMDSEGKNIKQLTAEVGYDGGPFFSADGKKITWRRFNPDGSKAEIFTMNIDGSEQTQVTKLNSMSWAPFFHPSGDYIIFGSNILGFSNFELFIIDSKGLQKPVRVTSMDGFDGLASFSPDGKTLTWSHRNEKGESQIYFADWNDQKARELLKLPLKTNQLADLSESINEVDAKMIVRYLASDDFKGRSTGSSEEKIYTDKIAELFKKWGLKPLLGQQFIQTFDFTSGVEVLKNNSAAFKGKFEKPLVLGKDYQIVSFSKSGALNATPIVFAGYGLKAPATQDVVAYDSYKDLDVQGKIVIVFDQQPIPQNKDFKKHIHLLNYSRLQHKITVAKNKGAVGLVVVTEGPVGDFKFEGALSDSQIAVLKISPDIFQELLKKADLDSSLKSVKSLKLSYDNYEKTVGFSIPSIYFGAEVQLKPTVSTGRNVIGVLYPEKKSNSKMILIGAHGDHLGLGQSGSSLAKGADKGQIHFGADDNASGTAGVLELAHYYSGQTRSISQPIVFAVWSGEEIGVLGSTSFVKNWKSMSISKKSFSESFEAGLNMDMIGRYRDRLFVQGVGSAKDEVWNSLFEKISSSSSLSLSLTADPYLPTDSMALYLGDIPSITFFTGAHSEYHTPQDRPETLNYKGLVDVIGVVAQTADQLQKNSLTFNKIESDSNKKLEGRSFRIYLGTIPDYSQEGVQGVRISGTSKDSPAEKAGLKSGDIIKEFGATKIENIYDYVYTLQTIEPNKKTKMKIQRKDEKLELDITPVLKE